MVVSVFSPPWTEAGIQFVASVRTLYTYTMARARGFSKDYREGRSNLHDGPWRRNREKQRQMRYPLCLQSVNPAGALARFACRDLWVGPAPTTHHEEILISWILTFYGRLRDIRQNAIKRRIKIRPCVERLKKIISARLIVFYGEFDGKLSQFLLNEFFKCKRGFFSRRRSNSNWIDLITRDAVLTLLDKLNRQKLILATQNFQGYFFLKQFRINRFLL